MTRDNPEAPQEEELGASEALSAVDRFYWQRALPLFPLYLLLDAWEVAWKTPMLAVCGTACIAWEAWALLSGRAKMTLGYVVQVIVPSIAAIFVVRAGEGFDRRFLIAWMGCAAYLPMALIYGSGLARQFGWRKLGATLRPDTRDDEEYSSSGGPGASRWKRWRASQAERDTGHALAWSTYRARIMAPLNIGVGTYCFAYYWDAVLDAIAWIQG